MNEVNKKERMFDLLNEKVIYGLNEENQQELEDLLELFPEWDEDETLSLTAAAISLSKINAEEEMPAYLKTKILSDSDEYFFGTRDAAQPPIVSAAASNEVSARPAELPAQRDDVSAAEKQISAGGFFSTKWLGWAVAAAACAALIFNIVATRRQNADVAQNPPTAVTPTVQPTTSPSLADERARLLAAPDVVICPWTDFNPKQPRNVQGDVVWSDAEQKGFVRFRGLPINDQTHETYQLWIFDANQNAKTPIEAGVFDVGENGEVIFPINASLKVVKPKMFAVTAEKPGGVVISNLGKVMAVAKIQT